MENEHDFRAVSDRMLDIIERLRTVERSKHDEPLGSQAFVDRSAEAEELSRLLFRWAGIELQMAEASVDAVRRGELERTTISTVRTRPIDRILASWREAQLRFELARPGSPEAEAAANDVERLREEFQAAREARMAGERG